jgi:hypothetical protein
MARAIVLQGDTIENLLKRVQASHADLVTKIGELKADETLRSSPDFLSAPIQQLSKLYWIESLRKAYPTVKTEPEDLQPSPPELIQQLYQEGKRLAVPLH